MSKVKKDLIKQAEKLVKRSTTDNSISSIIYPNRLEVGLDDESFKKGFHVFGDTTMSGNMAIKESGYANFGTTIGSSGHGVRDNDGTMQFKNSGGSWADIGSGGGGTPGGSSTQVQFNSNGSFAGDSNFTFNSTSDTLTVNNMSSSLTRLPTGVSYLIGGSNVIITSASNGQITITSTAGGSSRDKVVRKLTSDIPSGDSVTLTGADWTLGGFDPDRIDIYLNGQMLYSGSNEDYQLTANQNDQVTFNLDLKIDDIITSAVLNTGGSGGGGSGDITSVIAGNGLTGGGTSGAVTVTVQASDSKISVGAGGISVDESNFSSIPNSALSNNSITIAGSSTALGGTVTADAIAAQISGATIANSQLANSTISGKSLGANLGTATFQSGLTGTTYNGSGDVTIENTGVTSIAAGSGISVNSATGAVTVTNTQSAIGGAVAYIITTAKIVLPGTSGLETVLFDSAAAVNTNVVSSVSNGVFTLASTGYYKVTGFIVVEADAQNRSDVKIRFNAVDGSNATTSYESVTVSTLTSTSVKLQIIAAYFNFTDASTRTVKMEILATVAGAGEDITTINDKGYPYAMIEITKLT